MIFINVLFLFDVRGIFGTLILANDYFRVEPYVSLYT